MHTEIVHRVIEQQQQQLTTPDFGMSDGMGQVAVSCDLCLESYNDPLQLTIHKMVASCFLLIPLFISLHLFNEVMQMGMCKLCV